MFRRPLAIGKWKQAGLIAFGSLAVAILVAHARSPHFFQALLLSAPEPAAVLVAAPPAEAAPESPEERRRRELREARAYLNEELRPYYALRAAALPRYSAGSATDFDHATALITQWESMLIEMERLLKEDHLGGFQLLKETLQSVMIETGQVFRKLHLEQKILEQEKALVSMRETLSHLEKTRSASGLTPLKTYLQAFESQLALGRQKFSELSVDAPSYQDDLLNLEYELGLLADIGAEFKERTAGL